MSTKSEYLDRLLVSRIRLVKATEQTYEHGLNLAGAVLDCPRLILVERGTVHYQLDQCRWLLEPGNMVLVPAYLLRSWTVTDMGPLTLIWFEYTTYPRVSELPNMYWARSAVPQRDISALRRLTEIFAGDPQSSALEAEGEMKALLARFLAHATPTVESQDVSHALHQSDRAVADAARLFADELALPDAIARAIRRSRLSPNHFRLVFKQRMNVSPQQYLMQLRMKEARFLLHETDALVKEIASRIGYADEFHFSRIYKKFWGHPPTWDRKLT